MRPTSFFAALLLIAAACATTPAASTPGLEPELRGYAYPFAVHEFAFEAQRQQLRMVYMDERPANWNGRTVLLLHGKNFSGAYWEPTMRALVARGYQVIAPDQTGVGKATKRVIVVGHSMGGMLAVRFALQHPEQTGKLVLVNPIGLEDYGALVAYRGIEDSYRQELAATPGEWKPEYESLLAIQAGWTQHPAPCLPRCRT